MVGYLVGILVIIPFLLCPMVVPSQLGHLTALQVLLMPQEVVLPLQKGSLLRLLRWGCRVAWSHRASSPLAIPLAIPRNHGPPRGKRCVMK